MSYQLPLCFLDIPPEEGDFIKFDLTNRTSMRGFPEGLHTGGPWIHVPTGEYWKPLDALPYRNARASYSTQEAECLEALADLPLFPRNWRVEERNGRRWLIRTKAAVLGQDILPGDMQVSARRDLAFLVEGSIRIANNRGWEIGDDLSLAQDNEGRWFILDISSGHQLPGTGPYAPDDTDSVRRFMEWIGGLDDILELRQTGRDLAIDFVLRHSHEIPNGWYHVYLLKDPKATVPAESCLLSHCGKEWAVTPTPLGDRPGLVWAWSPLYE